MPSTSMLVSRRVPSPKSLLSVPERHFPRRSNRSFFQGAVDGVGLDPGVITTHDVGMIHARQDLSLAAIKRPRSPGYDTERG